MTLNLESTDSLPPDEEPKLKYVRMENDVCDILQKDTVSCICVHTKFICLGTVYGVIHLLDHEGNTVPFGGGGNGRAQDKELRAHAVAVNAISVDASGEYLASCSDDGKVLVYGLYSDDNTHCLQLGCKVSCVALDPQYHKSGSGRRFVVGDDKLTLYEKWFLSRLRGTCVSGATSGAVLAAAWQGRFVAWASESGVRVYDLTARLSLGLIVWEPAALAHKPRLRWADELTLMIGWGDTVRICLVRRRPGPPSPQGEYLLDPLHTFQTEYLVCGLGPLDDHLVLLGVPKEEDLETGRPQRPVLVVAEYRGEYAEISTDTLNIRGFDSYTTDEYHLDMVAEENRLFIVSPKEIVVASPYSVEERVTWLMDHGRYERALQVAEAGGAGRHTADSVTERYVAWLLKEGRGAEAAALAARVAHRPGWERLVPLFAEINQLRSLSPHVPTTPGALTPHVYELILYEYLKVDAPGFLRLVRLWDPQLYRTGVIVKGVLEHLLTTEVDKELYLEALAILYSHQKKYDKALTTYLTLQNKEVFTLISKHSMYDVIQDKILELMTLDADRAVDVLVEKSTVPPELVERQLEGHDALLLKYLDAHHRNHPAGRYHGRLVRLYATLQPEKLLPFLRSSDQYPIQEALDLCQSLQLYPETVFLLGRIGNSREALHVIMDRLQDIERAIQFCQEQNDPELWSELIDRAVDDPEHVTLLLRRVGGHVDPRLLLCKVPGGVRVPGLQPALTKMMRDHRLQLSVQEACRAITLRNYFEVHAKLVSSRSRGFPVSDLSRCGSCGERVVSPEEVVVFSCHHTYHLPCLHSRPNCLICRPP